MAPLFINLGILGKEGKESIGFQVGLGLQILILQENRPREENSSFALLATQP
jgi:hypothetical protein